MPPDEKERARFRNAFGTALDEQLTKRGLSQSALAVRLGTSRSYVNQTMTGSKPASPEFADKVGTVMAMTPVELGELHRAAAVSAGYRVDLPQPKKHKRKIRPAVPPNVE